MPFPAKEITGWQLADDYPALAELETLGLAYDYSSYALTCSDPAFHATATVEEHCALSHCIDGAKLAGWPGWANIRVMYPDCPLCGVPMTQPIFQIGPDDHLPYYLGDGGQGQILQCPTHHEMVAFSWDCC
jgi:hypothetical protein